jgi:hypothetical protein
MIPCYLNALVYDSRVWQYAKGNRPSNQRFLAILITTSVAIAIAKKKAEFFIPNRRESDEPRARASYFIRLTLFSSSFRCRLRYQLLFDLDSTSLWLWRESDADSDFSETSVVDCDSYDYSGTQLWAKINQTQTPLSSPLTGRSSLLRWASQKDKVCLHCETMDEPTNLYTIPVTVSVTASYFEMLYLHIFEAILLWLVLMSRQTSWGGRYAWRDTLFDI